MVADAQKQWASLNRVRKPSAGSTPKKKKQKIQAVRNEIPTSPLFKIHQTRRTPKAASVSLRAQHKVSAQAQAQAQETEILSPPSPVAAVRTSQPAPRADIDFNSIPDYSPPASTLNEDSKFRVEWKGTQLDLSNDPHKHLLHPAELYLASVLRLPCASYLTLKRRIFKEKVERTRLGLRFHKIDFQKVCRIDVNKASKLWSAYDHMGWFGDEFITPHLSRPPKVVLSSPRSQKGYEAFARLQETGILSPPSPVEARTATRQQPQAAYREDAEDFDSIPDYSPPLSTLNENSKFKVEWRGTPFDLSNDPHRDLLHPAEIHLASVLRLSCASYLASKRRIFNEKVERTRLGLKFLKTDSQKACKIDVNKASKLWSAFSAIGWFDDKFIDPHL